ncbi:MAG: threonine synthase [Pseudomonadota bacterium]
MGTTVDRCFVTHLSCSKTGERLPAGQLHNLSPSGAPLLVHYDLDAVGRAVRRQDLRDRAPTLWRYRELLPVQDLANRVSLGEQMTPLVELPRLGGSRARLTVKDEGRLPTGSFKARGLVMAVTMARELGASAFAIPTNGNAGAALSAYAARAGLPCHVFCPKDTPAINIEETALQGATVYRVDGYINDCGRLVGERRAREGWFDVSTLKEPYRIEGKKTMGLELAEQLGWRLPDVIFYPTGGGTGLIGMWKAFAELRELGWLDDARMPRMVAVQASGCAPIVRAFERGDSHAQPWVDPHTVATGIRVPAAIGDFLILKAVRESGGFAIAVDDEHTTQSVAQVAAQEGLLLCPEGAATYVAWQLARERGLIGPTDHAVLFNCATGLKYPLPPVDGPVVGASSA